VIPRGPLLPATLSSPTEQHRHDCRIPARWTVTSPSLRVSDPGTRRAVTSPAGRFTGVISVPAAAALDDIPRAWTTADDEAAREALHRNASWFEELAARAERLLSEGRHADASAHALAAAECAWLHHNGRFADLRLEQLLLKIGDTVVGLPRRGSEGGDILHVLTEAHGIGGHTRLVARWIASDARRRHTVLLTRQAGRLVPSLLVGAVAQSGGGIIVLDDQAGHLLDHAAALRRIAARHSLLVLHAHPSDVVPLMALAGMRERPRLVTLNHADHVFWLGVTISDGVACLRPCGENLARSRRGVQADRLLRLPVPVTVAPRSPAARQRARRALGVPDDALVALSVAAAYKYATPYGGPGFPEVLADACRAIPTLHVLVAGPESTGSWAVARRRGGGRVRALGVCADLHDLHCMADLYLDSFPFGSSTAALEAAAAALPVLSMPVWKENLPLATSHSEALDRVIITAAAPDGLVSILRDAARDRAETARMGEAVRREVLESHAGEGWRTRLRTMYADVERLPSESPCPRRVSPRTEPADLILSQLPTPDGAGPHGSLGAAVDYLTAPQRLHAGVRFLRRGGGPSRHLLRLVLPRTIVQTIQRHRPRR
jgi:hypothetical protein